jgi:Ni/Fe-hydrogenase subunit HybB-like protein
VRPAVLTAFLGYVAVALGLMVDLGRPWNIWRPIFYWQTDSPLFEVAWCVMLYLTVLLLEFLPVVFEGLRMNRAYRFMRRLTLPLVIAGIGLSTLHQSSLGTLFLLARDRVHPLWYSPLLPLLFFVSAVGLGLMMVMTESRWSSWVFRRKGEWPLLGGLSRAAVPVLGLYLVLRFGDLAWRSQLHLVVVPSWMTVLFWVEIGLSALVPMALFSLPGLRGRPAAITFGAASGVVGFVLHRVDVGGLSHVSFTGQGYLPALTEVVVSVGLVSAMALIFLFFVERFPVWEDPPGAPDHFLAPAEDPVTHARFGGFWFGRAQMAGAAVVFGAVCGIVLLEATTAGSARPTPMPVAGPRSVAAVRHDQAPPAARLQLVGGDSAVVAATQRPLRTALLIDGDRAGVTTVFDHADHQRRLGGEASCGRCHHRTLRLDRGTSCAVCHRDMYRETDVFDHEAHVVRLEGNSSCVRCHRDPGAGRTRASATPCDECHATEVHPQAGVVAASGERSGIAPGYRHAMHRMCVGCHATERKPDAEPVLERCETCHRQPQAAPDGAAPPTAERSLVAALEVP